jgi:hypothetical protein
MAEPTGEHVTRGGKTGGLTDKYSYEANKSNDVAGFSKVDDNAGEVGATGTGGDHFSAAMHRGNAGNPQPGTQA